MVLFRWLQAQGGAEVRRERLRGCGGLLFMQNLKAWLDQVCQRLKRKLLPLEIPTAVLQWQRRPCTPHLWKVIYIEVSAKEVKVWFLGPQKNKKLHNNFWWNFVRDSGHTVWKSYVNFTRLSSDIITSTNMEKFGEFCPIWWHLRCSTWKKKMNVSNSLYLKGRV